MTSDHTVVIRCDGGEEIGYGHLSRCLDLARSFRKNWDVEVYFAVIRGSSAVEFLYRHEEKNIFFEEGVSCEESWIINILDKTKADLLILDIRTDLSALSIRRFAMKGVASVTIDDNSARSRVADYAVFPPVSQILCLDQALFFGKLIVGWEWMPFGRLFSHRGVEKRCLEINNERLRVLIAMGASDPNNLTQFVLDSVSDSGLELHYDVVVGPGYKKPDELIANLKKSGLAHVVYSNPDDLSYLVSEIAFGICAFGVTAYELAASEIPAIYICTSPDHEKSAQTFVDLNVGESLGMMDTIDRREFLSMIKKFTEKKLVNKMRNNCKSLALKSGSDKLTNFLMEELNGAGR